MLAGRLHHYPLAGLAKAPAGDAEVLTWLDGHSRYALDVTAHQPATGPMVRNRFLAAVAASASRPRP
jgi:hypothetical protein